MMKNLMLAGLLLAGFWLILQDEPSAPVPSAPVAPSLPVFAPPAPVDQATPPLPVTSRLVEGTGVTVVQPNPINEVGGACEAYILVGERIYNGPDGYGACFVEDADGHHFFINQRGVRWLLK